jgi:hypothetical protein
LPPRASQSLGRGFDGFEHGQRALAQKDQTGIPQKKHLHHGPTYFRNHASSMS